MKDSTAQAPADPTMPEHVELDELDELDVDEDAADYDAELDEGSEK